MSAKKKNSVNKTVLLYRTPTCPFCHMTEEFFKANKVKYKSIDVSANQKSAQEMVKKSGQMGVPVIDIAEKIIVGFDKPALKKALGIK
mgnify:CR=1 FL=1